MAFVNSVVFVKLRECCGICKGSQWKHVGQRGKFSERPYDETGSFKAEKLKLKAAITRQLNELAGRAAGVSCDVERKSLEQREGCD